MDNLFAREITVKYSFNELYKIEKKSLTTFYTIFKLQY